MNQGHGPREHREPFRTGQMSRSPGIEPSRFSTLPGSDDPLFARLWVEDRLRFGTDAAPGDAFDEATARLVCAAVRARGRLVVILPDALEQRAPFLLASALLRDWYDRHRAGRHASARERVLYFGTSVGIRDQLAQIRVAGMGTEIQLADVFRQRHLARTGGSAGARGAAAATSAVPLPEVVTAYAPADVAGVFDREAPQWVFLDLTTGRAPWALGVLAEAERRGLPVLAWTCDRMAEWISSLGTEMLVFRWARRRGSESVPDRQATRRDPSLLLSVRTAVLTPCVLAGEAAQQIGEHLGRATASLVRAAAEAPSSFYRDAVGVHWQYLRALETLCIPQLLYESEAALLWGVKRLRDLSAACERFRDSARTSRPGLVQLLDAASSALEEARSLLSEPPLWRAARDTALSAPAVDRLVIAFGNAARKRLFSYALLAGANVSESELEMRGTRLATFSELDGLDPPPGRVLCVGLPPTSAGNRALSLFSADSVEVLVLPHQSAALGARARHWADVLGPDPAHNVATVAALGGGVELALADAKPALHIAPVRFIEGGDGGSARTTAPTASFSLPTLDPAAELARLFGNGEDEESPAVGSGAEDSASQEAGSGGGEVWSDTAVSLRFEGGWWAEFAPDDRITVVLGGGRRELEERFVRAVRPGDAVLAMPGQRRQSLYGLLVSRVHRHPAIQLHLTLVERWHAELSEAYARAARQWVGPADLLLREIQARGSTITSTITIQAWIRGAILCPQDPKDLYRVSEALEMPFTNEHHRQIYAAATRLRGLHRSLSQRIGRWLDQQLSGGYAADDAGDDIDAEWGVRFSDFRDSLLLLRAEQTEIIPGPFLRARLGQFNRETTL